VEEQGPSIVEQFERTSASIPWYGKQYLAAKLFILAVLISAGVSYGLAKYKETTDYQILTETVWCTDTILVEGVTRLQPNSLGIRNDFKRGRAETFQLLPNGKAILPGFNTEPVNAKWRAEDIYVEIYEADTFGNIYDDVYECYITPEFLKLVSPHTLIRGSRNGAY
jgi:hypothetical protein